LSEEGEIGIEDYPGDERSLIRKLQALSTRFDPRMVVLELQQAFPGQGVSSTFKLGQNYGIWLAAIASCGWPLTIVRPAEWKKGLGYPAKDKKEGKAYSLTLARRLYPAAAGDLARVKDHNRAEALLLAHYGKGLI
jgi:crossover junction endodeoxyribonuclease RuvC